MPKPVKMDVVDFDNVLKGLRELPQATQPNVVRRTIQTAAQPMIEIAKARARGLVKKGEGNLVASITIAKRLHRRADERTGRRRGDVTFYFGYNVEQVGATVPAAPHGHLFEFGTGNRRHKSGKSVGRVIAQPVIRPTYDTYSSVYIRRFSAQMGEEVDRAAKRLERKYARAQR